ncbi:MAG: aspartate--tRNA ligase [Erysipelotrichaceae bacterium]|nr:aspartate--tRNA ligase [Erysipelotrichaceae bacterium]
MNRTHHNNELNKSNVGQKVSLVGWVAKRRNFGAMVFIDLRDRNGITQIVIDETLTDSVKEIRNEYLLEVSGEVLLRKDANPKLASGEIEVKASKVIIINSAELTPMIIADETDALEDTRLKYRYLDLRRPMMQKRLIQRAKIVQTMRNCLDDAGFIDIETPMLTKSTPEGSREYLVPSRVHAGQFYALAQSPQIFKQMLMVAGFERYYQVARCFRDEDLRADRQLDFTQVDIEASFLNEVEFRAVIEDMVSTVMDKVLGLKLQLPLMTMSYADAMHFYGSDKPDLRFGLKLQELKQIFNQSTFAVFQNALSFKDGVIKAIVFEKGSVMTRKETDELTEVAKKNGSKGLVVLKYQNNALEGSVVKFMSPEEISGLCEVLSLKEGDLILITADKYEKACNALGAVRLALRDKFDLAKKDDFKYLWVVDFPLFEYNEEEDRYVAKHHPFTRPKEDELHLLKSDPASVHACAYDLVLNGFEVAGGSMRIYDQNVQKMMFEIIGFTKEQIESRFGFFIDAFQYGTPPHGGIAFGLDRFAMVLTQSDSIRDVIAFPKNASARCPLTDAPTPVDAKQLDELHLAIK